MAEEDPSPPTASSPARESPGPQPAEEDAPLPAGFIFRCDGATKPECFRYRVLGLPRRRLGAVSRIRRGAALFLFDFDARYLYGPYRADSDGGRDLEPAAFQGRLPAQVKFVFDGDFMPVRGKTMRYTIKENYPGKFLPELTLTQVEKLRALFRPINSLPVPEAPPLHYVDNSQAAPSAVFLPPSASDPNYETTVPEHVTDPACSSDPNYETTSGRAAPPHEVSATNPQLVMHYGYAPGSEGATGELRSPVLKGPHRRSTPMRVPQQPLRLHHWCTPSQLHHMNWRLAATNPQLAMHNVYALGSEGAEGAASAVHSHAGAPATIQAAPLVYAVAAAPANL